MDGQLGSGWMKNIHSDDHHRAMSAWRKSFEEGVDYDVEYRLRGKDATYRWFKARGIPVRDADRTIVKWFGTCTDIEDIVQAREVLAQSRAELESLVQERTAQLEETTAQLNNFCYSIAHDLRAPLRAQNAYARILLEDFGASLGETGQDFAHRIINAAEKLDRLVHDLLSHVSLSRTDLPLEKVDMSTAITQVRADFSEQIHKAHARVTVGSVEGIVMAHEPSLNLIIANLLSNALKYCKPGVPPAIAIRAEHRPEGMLRLWIEDEGIGIKPEYHERIFGVFQRLHTGHLPRHRHWPGAGAKGTRTNGRPGRRGIAVG
jgi:light-regulated signal transduction histidine kinase (bacteriophytochrome)